MLDEKQINLPKIAQPAIRALQSVDINYLNQLSTISKSDLLNLHGMGKKGVEILENEMKLYGIKFLQD